MNVDTSSVSRWKVGRFSPGHRLCIFDLRAYFIASGHFYSVCRVYGRTGSDQRRNNGALVPGWFMHGFIIRYERRHQSNSPKEVKNLIIDNTFFFRYFIFNSLYGAHLCTFRRGIGSLLGTYLFSNLSW